MKIILDVFNELHFVLTDEFLVEYAINENNSMVVNVNLLISSENDSQVFLMIDCENAQLLGKTEGNNQEEAFENLLKKYPYLKDTLDIYKRHKFKRKLITLLIKILKC